MISSRKAHRGPSRFYGTILPIALALAAVTSLVAQGTALPPSVHKVIADNYVSESFETRYLDASADLNGDGRAEVIVHVIGPMACGTGGCPTLVFTPDEATGYRLVTTISITRPPVRMSGQVTNGWHNLIVRVAGGGAEAHDAELEFDGRTYPANPSVPPAKPAAGYEGAVVLIPEFESFDQARIIKRDTAFDAVVQPFVTSGRFMGSALVARGDEVVFSKGYGYANLEWDVRNDSATKFRLGSITKQFTSALILLLQEDGKLSIQDPVSRYVPEAPASWSGITLYHLLTHTSGIHNFTALPDYRVRQVQPSSPAAQVERLRDEPLDFAPGTEYRYSNSGYLILGLVIERVTGRRYAEVLQERIFGPLGMGDSGYDSNVAVIPHRASGYAPGPNGPMNARFVDMTVPHAAGALYSTTGDLLKWMRGLFGGRVLKPASLSAMTTPNLNNYALGLTVREVDGTRMIGHGGSINGFNAFLVYYPQNETTVAVLANLSGNAPQQIALALGAAANQ